MNVLAIIPARGGSKSIPLKNIQKLGNKALIEYTITAAKKSKEINKIIVSTDSKKISTISKKIGAEVPFLRPKKFSQDNSPAMDVIKHTLKFLKEKQSYVPEIVTILLTTSPFRTPQMIDKSVRLLKNSNATCVLGVSKIKKEHPYRAFWPNGKYLKPLKSDFTKYYRRQIHPTCYYPNGMIYTFWYQTLKKFNTIYGSKIKPLIEDENNIDIDNLFDLFIAEMKIKNWKEYKKKIYSKSMKTLEFS